MTANRTKRAAIALTLLTIAAFVLAACGLLQPPTVADQIREACAETAPGSTIPFGDGTVTCAGGEAPAAEGAPAPTTAPAAYVETPAAPANAFVALNYDETNSDPLTPGQNKLVALYLRDAMGAGGTQAAMETAIVAIQNEAATAGATTYEGSTLTLEQHQAWLVWCSNAEGADFPTDTSDVFDKLRHGPGMVWIQVPFAQEVPIRSKDTFSSCTGGDFWAVAVH